MIILNIINGQGQIEGTVDPEKGTVKAIAKPLKSLLAKFKRGGIPTMIGDSNDSKAHDGFENIKPDDSRYINALGTALAWEGYRFAEIEGGD